MLCLRCLCSGAPEADWGWRHRGSPLGWQFTLWNMKYYWVTWCSLKSHTRSKYLTCHTPAPVPDHCPFKGPPLLHLLPLLLLSHYCGFFPTHPLNVSGSKNYSVFCPLLAYSTMPLFPEAWYHSSLYPNASQSGWHCMGTQQAEWMPEWTMLFIHSCIFIFYTCNNS